MKKNKIISLRARDTMNNKVVKVEMYTIRNEARNNCNLFVSN